MISRVCVSERAIRVPPARFSHRRFAVPFLESVSARVGCLLSTTFALAGGTTASGGDKGCQLAATVVPDELACGSMTNVPPLEVDKDRCR